MASEKCWLAIGLSLLMLSLVIYSIGFGSPYWLEKFDEIDTPLERLGLWQICFSRDGMTLQTKEQEAMGMIYRNCYWIFHEDLKLANDVTAKSKYIFIYDNNNKTRSSLFLSCNVFNKLKTMFNIFSKFNELS